MKGLLPIPNWRRPRWSPVARVRSPSPPGTCTLRMPRPSMTVAASNFHPSASPPRCASLSPSLKRSLQRSRPLASCAAPMWSRGTVASILATTARSVSANTAPRKWRKHYRVTVTKRYATFLKRTIDRDREQIVPMLTHRANRRGFRHQTSRKPFSTQASRSSRPPVQITAQPVRSLDAGARNTPTAKC